MITRTKRAITPIIAVIMMLLMTVAAASAVFTWYQQFQQQQLQQVSKRAAALAQNIQFSITDTKWMNPYPPANGEVIAQISDGTNTTNLTIKYVTFYTVIQNTGDDMDLNSKNPLAYLEIDKLATGTQVARSNPGYLVDGETSNLDTYPLYSYIEQYAIINSTVPSKVLDNIINITYDNTTDTATVELYTPIACFRYVPPGEKLDHPANIVASGETARLQCILLTEIDAVKSDATYSPKVNLVLWNGVKVDNLSNYTIANYDPAYTYQEVITYGTTSQSAQILK